MIKNIKGFIIAIITVLGLGIIAYFGYLFLNKYTNEKNITNFDGTYKIKNDSFKDYGVEILAKK